MTLLSGEGWILFPTTRHAWTSPAGGRVFPQAVEGLPEQPPPSTKQESLYWSLDFDRHGHAGIHNPFS